MAADWRQKRWLAGLLGLYLLLGLAYSLLLPPWEAPDEMAHYEYVLHIVREDSLPTMEDTYEAGQPPFYYWLASWPLRLLGLIQPDAIEVYAPSANADNITEPRPVFDWNDANYRFDRLLGLLSLRWLGVLSGGLTLFFIYKAALRLAHPASQIALATAATAALTPQFLHINASVNNDVLAILAGGLLFWLLAVLIQEQPRWPLLAASVAFAVLAALFVKLTVLPLTLAVLLAVLWNIYRRTRDLRTRILTLGLLGGLGLIVVIALFTTAAGDGVVAQINWRLSFIRPDVPDPPEIINRYAETYWGLVGWVAVGLPTMLVGLLTSVAALGCLASLRLWLGSEPLIAGPWRRPTIRHKRRVAGSLALLLPLAFILRMVAGDMWIMHQLQTVWLLIIVGWLIWWFLVRPAFYGSRAGWFFVWLTLALAALILGRNALATKMYQGRFLFPSIGPLMLLTTTGLFVMWPSRLAALFWPAVVAVMIAVNLTLLLSGILPVYYQPWLG